MAAGGEVLPPWKQGEFTTEASYTSMTSSTITQLDQEQHWEQQVTGVKEVRGGQGCERTGGRTARIPEFHSVMSLPVSNSCAHSAHSARLKPLV